MVGAGVLVLRGMERDASVWCMHLGPQVSLEGAIAKDSASAALAQGMQPSGDMIPWTVSQQFQDSAFPTLSGARIIRISVHPELQRGGYGQRAVDLLHRYFEGQLADLQGSDEEGGDDEQGGSDVVRKPRRRQCR